jgi:hypothetical protein
MRVKTIRNFVVLAGVMRVVASAAAGNSGLSPIVQSGQAEQ